MKRVLTSFQYIVAAIVASWGLIAAFVLAMLDHMTVAHIVAVPTALLFVLCMYESVALTAEEDR